MDQYNAALMAELKKRRRRQETRRVIIHLLLSGLLGVWLISVGLSLKDWQYFAVVITSQALYVNARL